MSNTLTFSNPITLPALTGARLMQAREINTTQQRVVLDIEFYGEGFDPETRAGWSWYRPLAMEVTNGPCDRLLLRPYPLMHMIDVEKISPDLNPALSQAFSIVIGAYFQGGDTAVLQQMAELGLLPPGVAA